MKAKDLMIGDWVYQDDNLCENRPCKITGVIAGVSNHDVVEVTGERFPLHASHIKPIPITPEIMKKNGFKPAKDCDYVYTYDDPDIVIDLFEPNNPRYKKTREEYMKEVGISLLQSNYLFGPLNAAIIIKAFYVHELQHFIKPCGIEKDIVL